MFQIDLLVPHDIHALLVQGCATEDYFVRTFNLRTSGDGVTWDELTDPDTGSERVRALAASGVTGCPCKTITSSRQSCANISLSVRCAQVFSTGLMAGSETVFINVTSALGAPLTARRLQFTFLTSATRNGFRLELMGEPVGTSALLFHRIKVHVLHDWL